MFKKKKQLECFLVHEARFGESYHYAHDSVLTDDGYLALYAFDNLVFTSPPGEWTSMRIVGKSDVLSGLAKDIFDFLSASEEFRGVNATLEIKDSGIAQFNIKKAPK